MSKKQVVGSMSDWSGVLKDFFRQIDDGSITLERLKNFVGHNPVADWQNFYKNVFGIEVNLQTPQKQKGFDRLIVVAKGMTPQLLYNKCEELFPCWKWTGNNLDKIVESERKADKDYAIWVRDRIEADEELKNLSANNLKEKNISCVTLEERLLYELKYFIETGGHLDIENVTLCTGSRYSDGSVPYVHWNDGLLRVGWDHPGSRDGVLRSRRAVP